MAFAEPLIHSAPLACSIFEILATEMFFLHRDSWYMLAAGCTYTFFNLAGHLILKTIIYPGPLDWSNFWLSFCIYMAQGPVLYGINECIANCTQKRRKAAVMNNYLQSVEDGDTEAKQGLNTSASLHQSQQTPGGME